MKSALFIPANERRGSKSDLIVDEIYRHYGIFVLITIVKRAIVNETSDRLNFRVSRFKKSNRFDKIVRQSREECRNIDGDYRLLLSLVVHYHFIMSSMNNSLDVIKLNSKKRESMFRYFALYVSTIACLLFNN